MLTKAFFRIMAIAAIAVTANAATPAAVCQTTSTNDTWKNYTAFDCQPRKILDGNRYTYFLVYQTYYSPTAYHRGGEPLADYGDPVLGLLYYDKQNPTAGIRSVHELGRFNTGQISNAAYNPRGGCLLIAYSDGAIDIVRDNGKIDNITTLKERAVPFPVVARNISFALENNDAWIATSYGFIHVDCDAAKVLEAVDLGMSVTDICRVGDKVVAITQQSAGTANELYEADATKTLRSRADFVRKEMPVDQLDFIMPVGNDAFALLTNRTQLSMAKRDVDGKWSLSNYITDDGFRNQLVNTTENGSYVGEINRRSYVFKDNENNLVLTSSGYYIFSKNTAYHISSRPGDDGKLKIEQRNFAVTYPTWTGTNDFENFWFYDHRKGFHCDKAEGYGTAATWTRGDILVPDAPVGLVYARLDYSPKHGVLVSNNGTPTDRHNEGRVNPMLISGYKNGRWTNYCPAYPVNIPASAQSGGYLNELFNAQTNNYDPYPLADPMGLTVDPLYPEYVYAGSIWNGMVALNLDKRNSDVLHFATKVDAHNYYANFVSMFPQQWASYSYLWPMGHDADNTIWMYYPDLNSGFYGEGNGVHLFYWTAQNRKNALETNSADGDSGWKRIFVPESHGVSNDFCSYAVALKYMGNRNKLLMAKRKDAIMVLDHNGTLENTGDDKYWMITKIIDNNGVTYSKWGYIYGVVENPNSGKVFVMTGMGLYEVNPSSCSGNVIKGEEFSITNPDGSKTKVIPSMIVRSIKFDEYGRCWIATDSNGVYCVSADQTKVIAHYSMRNSTLPSNEINDVCWNPDTQELVIATARGICSVRPDAPDASGIEAGGKPYLYPAAVNPDFAGSVVLHNIPQGSSIEVQNAVGKVVRSLGMTSNGRLVWDLRDNDGNSISTGVYRLMDTSGLINDILLPVVK